VGFFPGERNMTQGRVISENENSYVKLREDRQNYSYSYESYYVILNKIIKNLKINLQLSPDLK
jgi:hypothetical protein